MYSCESSLDHGRISAITDTDAAASLLRSFGIDDAPLTDLLLVEEALRRGVSVNKELDQRFITFARDGRRLLWREGETTRNTLLARRLTARPVALAQFLSAYDQPGSEAIAFDAGAAERAWAWAQAFKRVVVKPTGRNDASRAYLNIRSWEDFQIAFDATTEASNGRALVEPYVVGEHYRCLVIGGSVVAAVRVRPTGVIGDGRSTINQLLDAKNLQRGEVHFPLTRGRREFKMLSKQGFSPASVPSAGMYVQLRDSGQLHAGGDIIEAMGELKPAEIRRIRTVVATVPGLRVAEATISVPRLEEDDPMRIFDINPTVRLDIYHRPWEGKPFDAAGAVLDPVFPIKS